MQRLARAVAGFRAGTPPPAAAVTSPLQLHARVCVQQRRVQSLVLREHGIGRTHTCGPSSSAGAGRPLASWAAAMPGLAAGSGEARAARGLHASSSTFRDADAEPELGGGQGEQRRDWETDVLISRHKGAKTTTFTGSRELPNPEEMQGAEQEIAQLQQQVHSLWKEGLVEDAKAAATACVTAVDALFGGKHPVFASAMNNLGLLHKQSGEWDDAVRCLADAIRVYKDVLGDEHPNTLVAMANLGQVYKTMALEKKAMERGLLLESALSIYEEVLAAQKKSVGETDPGFGVTLQNIGAVMRLLGKGEEDTTPLIRRGKEVVATALRFDHPAVATALNNLGIELKARAHFDEASALYEEALQIRTVKLGAAHSETIVIMHNLAELLLAQGRDAEAATLQNKILDIIGVDPDADEKEQTDQPTRS